MGYERGHINHVPIVFLEPMEYEYDCINTPDAHLMFCRKVENNEPVYFADWWDTDISPDDTDLPVPSNITDIGRIRVEIDKTTGNEIIRKDIDKKALEGRFVPRRVEEWDIKDATDTELIQWILDRCRMELDMWYGMIITGCHPFSLDPEWRKKDREHVDDWTRCYCKRRLTADVIESEISRHHFSRHELEIMAGCTELLSEFGDDDHWSNASLEDSRADIHKVIKNIDARTKEWRERMGY